MACLTNKITVGYSSCGGNMPGVKRFWLANYDDVVSISLLNEVVTGITMSGSTKWFAFEPSPRTTLYEDILTKSIENGISYYVPSLTTKLAGLSSTAIPIYNKIIKSTRLIAVIESTDGVLQVLGKTNGLMAETGAKVTRGLGGEEFVGAEIKLSSYDGESDLSPTSTVVMSTLV
jgi:hypothetical protein